MNNLILRKADLSEVKEASEIYLSVLGSEGTTWNESYPTFDDAAFDQAHGCLYVLVSVPESKIIGTVSVVYENELNDLSFWHTDSGTEISRVAIHPEYQGHGYAYIMLDLLFKSLNTNAIRLLVAKKNIAAQKTYKKLGFEFLDECFMYDIDFYIAEKLL